MRKEDVYEWLVEDRHSSGDVCKGIANNVLDDGKREGGGWRGRGWRRRDASAMSNERSVQLREPRHVADATKEDERVDVLGGCEE